jgi:hypothetical protein
MQIEIQRDELVAIQLALMSEIEKWKECLRIDTDLAKLLASMDGKSYYLLRALEDDQKQIARFYAVYAKLEAVLLDNPVSPV